MEEIISIIAVIFAGVIAFIFGRDFIRGRVPDDNDSIGQIRDSIEEAGKINQQSGDTIDAAQDAAGDISADNTDARDGIKTARNILKRAKDRSDADTG